MNILLLTTHLNYGGISAYSFSLVKDLVKRGHTVFIGSSSGDLIPQLEQNNLTHIRIPINTKTELSPLLFVSLCKILHFIKHNPIDVIHAQTRVTQVLAFYLHKMTQVPFVTTCHGFFQPNIGRQLLPCWGEKVIAISDAVKKHLMLDFEIPQNKIVLIPNGIDILRFKVAQSRKDINIPDRKLGIIARLSPVKGHRFLLEAMAQVIKDFPDATLMVFGEGKIKYELIKQTEKLKIKDHVLFLPAVSNTAEVLQEIDIFVMPSLKEGLGISILEAQACGIPVVATCVGGIPEVIKHEVTGLLVPAQNSAALAAAIMKIMQNKELSIKLSEQAKQDVEKKFNLGQMVDKVEQVYKTVVKK